MADRAEITELIEKKIKELPPLPVVVQKLVRTLEDELSSADDVMKVLSSDQALASKVLKLVNSSFYGLSGEIATPSRAVVILGFAAIRNLALGLSVAKFMSLGSKEHQQEFWHHAITVAAACQVLAKRTGYPDAEEAFIAGLLHDIGQVVLGLAVPGEYESLLGETQRDLVPAEERRIGLSHARAGQMLLKHWKLPRNLTAAVRYHHNATIFCKGEDPLVSLVALADAVACVHGTPQEIPFAATELLSLMAATGFDCAEIGETLDELTARIEETKVFLQIATDASEEAPAPPVAVAERIVLVSADKSKLVWTRGILGFFGSKVVSVKDFFANPGADATLGLVILDPGSISDEQLQKMKPRLATTSLPIALLAGDEDGRVKACLGREFPALPLAFSRSELNGVSVGAPVATPA